MSESSVLDFQLLDEVETVSRYGCTRFFTLAVVAGSVVVVSVSALAVCRYQAVGSVASQALRRVTTCRARAYTD